MLKEFKFKGASTKEHEYMLHGTKLQHGGSPEGFVGSIAGETGNKKKNCNLENLQVDVRQFIN